MFSSLKKIYQNEETFRATLILIIMACFLSTIFIKFSSVIGPFLAAIILSSLLNSWISVFQRVGIPRGVGAAFIIIVLITSILLMIIVLSFFIQKHFLYYSKHIHSTISFLANWIPQKLNEIAIQIHIPFEINAEKIRNYLMNSLGIFSEMIVHYAFSVYEGAKSLVSIFSFFFFVPILTFYLLKDWPRFISKIREYTPNRILIFLDFALPRAKESLKNQMKGQFKVSFIVFIMYSLSLFFIGLKSFIFLGFLSGILTFIPFIGIFIAFIIAFIAAFSQGLNIVHIMAIVILYFVGSSIESNFLTPRFVGAKIGLHPVWIFFSVLTVLACFGISGALFVMPLATLVWSFIQSTLKWLRDEDLS